MDSDSEGKKNQGVLVGKEGAVMIDIILATLVGLLAVIVIVMIPTIFVTALFERIDMDIELEETNNNNQNENGNN